MNAQAIGALRNFGYVYPSLYYESKEYDKKQECQMSSMIVYMYIRAVDSRPITMLDLEDPCQVWLISLLDSNFWAWLSRLWSCGHIEELFRTFTVGFTEYM